MRFFEEQETARSQTLWLLLMFVLTLLALVLAVNASLALVWRLVSWGHASYPAHFFTVNTVLTVIFVLGGWWLEMSALDGGGEQLARRAGAREARPSRDDAEQRFCNIVHELAIAAAMKPPKPMVVERVVDINAFACGWDERDAVVAVTRGALERLTRDELQGLVAHEFSHIREGDTRLNMRLAGMVSGLEMIFNLGDTMCATDDLGRPSILVVPGFAIRTTGALGWLAGRALKAAVSRQREFLADARAVQFTRSQDGLGGVLRKIEALQHQQGVASRALHPAVQHMLLVGGPERLAWFATHPPLADRIHRIYGRTMPRLPMDEVDAMIRRDTVF